MNKRLILFSAFLFFTTFSMAQLVNNGAVITVKDGATLIVDNDITNTSGSIVLEGNAIVEVSGDFTNDDIFTTSAGSTVKFYGSSDSNVKSNGHDFGNLILDKTAANLVLLDPFFLTTDVTFNSDNNKIDLGSYDFNLMLGSTLTSYDDNEYFQVDGSGMLKRVVSATGNYTFPVGDISAFSPIDVNITAGTVGATDPYVAVKVTDADHPNLLADADAYISRYWQLEANDISGYAATLTATYVDADVNGTETLINGASYVSDWSFAGADGDDGANTVTGDVTDLVVDFTGKNFYGRMASLDAILSGPYSGTEMTTSLTSLPLGTDDGDHFPDTSPYGTGESITSIPTDVTDWIKIEIRDAGDASSVLNSYGKFIKKDGAIVELDGSSTPRFKDAPTSGYVAIRHRNHLGIRTSSTIDFTTLASHDFSTGSGQAFGTNPMVEIATGIWGMWSGNSNGDSKVRYASTNNDTQDILNAVLNHSGNFFSSKSYQFQAYSNLDVNMNSYVRYASSNNDTEGILNEVLNHPGNFFGTKSYEINEQL